MIALSLPAMVVHLAVVKPPDDKVTPGTWGFVVVAALATATWFIIRSLLKHLGKVSFDDGSDEGSGAPTPGSGRSTGEHEDR